MTCNRLFTDLLCLLLALPLAARDVTVKSQPTPVDAMSAFDTGSKLFAYCKAARSTEQLGYCMGYITSVQRFCLLQIFILEAFCQPAVTLCGIAPVSGFRFLKPSFPSTHGQS